MHRVVVPTYQPIVDIQSGKISHFEALARMRDGSGRHGQLIEMGEGCGFINLIDEAMMDEVLRQLRARPCVRVAVNVSVRTLECSLGDLLSIMFRYMDCTDRLVVEITETLNIRQIHKLDVFNQALRLLKVKLAIDDFGDGFHTRDLVQRLRPDYLKLAEGVFRDLEATGDAEHLREVAKIAESAGAVLIAEHIDSERKVELMHEHGVRYAQGFLFGRGDPVPHGGKAWCKEVGRVCGAVCAREPARAKVFQVTVGAAARSGA